MQISVSFTGSLRDIVESEAVEIDVETGTEVGCVLKVVTGKFGLELEKRLYSRFPDVLREDILLIFNKRVVSPGDVVAGPGRLIILRADVVGG